MTAPSSIALYGAAVAVFAALTGLGRIPAHFIERRHRALGPLRLPLLAVAGWGLVALLSAAGALVDLDQDPLAHGLLVLGGVLLLLPGGAPAERRLLLRDLAFVALLAAPMGLLVAATPATAFDEFAQWLPNMRYLVEHGRYWHWPDWIGLSSKPGYPNGSAVVTLLIDQLVGPAVEAPFKTFGVILTGGFGAALAHLMAPQPTDGRRLLLPLGLGCLAAFAEPFFDPRIALTALADMSSAVVLALAVLVAAFGLGAARRGCDHEATAWFAWAGLLILTLVMLRTTNLVLGAALGLACFMLLPAARRRRPATTAAWAMLTAGPGALGVLVWHFHLVRAGIGPDMAPRSWAGWDWRAPLTVARVLLLDRLAGNPFLGAAAFGSIGVALAAGIAAWRRLDEEAGSDDRPMPRLLLAVTGIVALSFMGFLAWAYIAVFSAAETARAASLWRYLTELGPLAVLTACSVALGLRPSWQRAGGRAGRGGSILAGVAVCGLVLMLPVLGRPYYGVACRYPDVMAARAAAKALQSALEPYRTTDPGAPSRLAVVHPTMGDWMAYAVAYELHWPASDRVVRYRTGPETLALTEDWAWGQGLEAILDLTPLDRAALAATPIVAAVSLLGRPAAPGEPWRLLATTTPVALPYCSLPQEEWTPP